METIHLEKQGETLSFPTSEDEKTGRLEIDLMMAPGKSGPRPHIHTVSDEGFEVISGSIEITIDGKKSVLQSGEKVVIKAGQVHSFNNASETEPLVVKGFIEPALNFRWFIREMAKSANERGGSWDDVSILHAGYVLFSIRKEYRVGGIPFFIQDILFGLLAGIAKISGRIKSVQTRPVFLK